MSYMKFTSFTFLMLLVLAACKNDQSPQNTSKTGSETKEETKAESAQIIQQDDVLLLCQEVKQTDTEMDHPSFEVFLHLAESKVKVADILGCETIAPEQFEQYQIPTSAISAVGGWYAGAGDYLYIMEEGDNYVIKKGEMFEEKEDNNYNYQEIAKYSKNGNLVINE